MPRVKRLYGSSLPAIAVPVARASSVVATLVHREPHHRVDVRLGGRAPIVAAAKRPATEPEHGQPQVRVSRLPVIHGIAFYPPRRDRAKLARRLRAFGPFLRAPAEGWSKTVPFPFLSACLAAKSVYGWDVGKIASTPTPGRPKIVGAALGLALAAGAIAFNATHYPIAFPAGDAGGKSMPAAALSAAGKGDIPRLCEAPAGPFRRMGTVPFSAPRGTGEGPTLPVAGRPGSADVLVAQAGETPAPPRTSPLAATAVPAAQAGEPPAPQAPVVEKPMVPIMRPSSPRVPAEPSPGPRRLPPVDSASPPPAARPADGAIPIYPSTGK